MSNIPTFDLSKVSEQDIKALATLSPEEVLHVIDPWITEKDNRFLCDFMNPYELAWKLVAWCNHNLPSDVLVRCNEEMRNGEWPTPQWTIASCLLALYRAEGSGR